VNSRVSHNPTATTNAVSILGFWIYDTQGRNEGRARGAQFPGRRITMGAPNHHEGRQMTAAPPKSSNNGASTFFNTVTFLTTSTFEHRSAKLASCLGRHLTSLRPWWYDIQQLYTIRNCQNLSAHNNQSAYFGNDHHSRIKRSIF